MLDIVLRNSDMCVIGPKVYAMRDMMGVERIRMRSIDRRSVLYLLRPTMAWVAEAVKLRGWETARLLYSEPIDKLRVGMSYSTIESLMAGCTLLCVYWHYSRTGGEVQKEYGTMVLRY